MATPRVLESQCEWRASDVADESTFAEGWPRVTYTAGTDQLGSVDELAVQTPRTVPWPNSWITLVGKIKAPQRPSFLEICSGSAILRASFKPMGVHCGPPVDAADNDDENPLNPMFVAGMVAAWATAPRRLSLQ